MTYENAMRWYNFDPFAHVTREQATVGALRSASAGHDVATKALSHHEKEAGFSLAGYKDQISAATGQQH